MIIRLANEKDLHEIINLVKELAIYENAEKELIASIKTYQDAFKEGIFECLLAEKEQEIIGMALFYPSFSTWKGKMMYLEDFVVKEKARRSGVGQQLFDALLAHCKAKQCVLLKWQVLDWNEMAINFYKKNDALLETEWWNGKIFL